jgi:hypothetical protein
MKNTIDRIFLLTMNEKDIQGYPEFSGEICQHCLGTANVPAIVELWQCGCGQVNQRAVQTAHPLYPIPTFGPGMLKIQQTLGTLSSQREFPEGLLSDPTLAASGLQKSKLELRGEAP